jgi:hypothetical protein
MGPQLSRYPGYPQPVPVLAKGSICLAVVFSPPESSPGPSTWHVHSATFVVSITFWRLGMARLFVGPRETRGKGLMRRIWSLEK